jgi:hypothetical protein
MIIVDGIVIDEPTTAFEDAIVPFDKMVSSWVRKEMKSVFGRVIMRETISFARVRDVPITAVHMAEMEDYGFHIKGRPYV